MKTLLSFVGSRDPFGQGSIQGEDPAGPLLSLVAACPVDRAILLYTTNMKANAKRTAVALADRHPELLVDLSHIDVPDPTDYSGILRALRTLIEQLHSESLSSEYFVGLASGTPQMHACWMLLAAGGELPARLMYIRPNAYVSDEQTPLTEIDLSTSDFPIVHASISRLAAADESSIKDPVETARSLGIVGVDTSFTRVLHYCAQVADGDVPVLILGETGTGKEGCARLIHKLSPRADKPFVAINCGGIAESLIDSQLFGHVRGAFTGANKDRPGIFERAHGGTLFLDEVGELPTSVQVKLLRVLQEGEVEPLGDGQVRKVDVRILAATHVNLEQAVQDGSFREDLYYRLHVGRIEMPPLRQRRRDIVPIAQSILCKMNANSSRIRRFSSQALTKLTEMSWPGNIRQLSNVITISAQLCATEVIDVEDLKVDDHRRSSDNVFDAIPDPYHGFLVKDFLDQARVHLYERALDMAGSNQAEAARLLGVSAQSVNKYMREREA